MSTSVLSYLHPFSHNGNESLWIMQQGFVLRAINGCKYQIVGMLDHETGKIVHVYKYIVDKLTKVFNDIEA